MIVDFELIAGIKVGIEADEVYLTETEDQTPDFTQPPFQVIYLYLGIVSICMIFD